MEGVESEHLGILSDDPVLNRVGGRGIGDVAHDEIAHKVRQYCKEWGGGRVVSDMKAVGCMGEGHGVEDCVSNMAAMIAWATRGELKETSEETAIVFAALGGTVSSRRSDR